MHGSLPVTSAIVSLSVLFLVLSVLILWAWWLLLGRKSSKLMKEEQLNDVCDALRRAENERQIIALTHKQLKTIAAETHFSKIYPYIN